jgi:hypothetical protein
MSRRYMMIIIKIYFKVGCYWTVPSEDYPAIVFSVVQHFFVPPIGNSYLPVSVLNSLFLRCDYVTCFCSF